MINLGYDSQSSWHVAEGIRGRSVAMLTISLGDCFALVVVHMVSCFDLSAI